MVKYDAGMYTCLIVSQSLSPQWFMNDPTGRMVGIAIAVLVGLVALYYVLGIMKWASGRIKELMLGAAVIGAGVWASQFVHLSLTGWIVVAFVAFCMFVGWALFLTHGGSR